MGNSVICNGQSGTLSVAPGTYSYSWSGPGTVGTGFSVSVNQAGVYTLTTSNSCGSVTSTFTVDVSTPQAGFAPNMISGQAPATFTFTNSSLGTSLSNYWNLANGDTSLQINPVATYTNEGYYNVTLIVTDMYGCLDTADFTIFVTDTALPIIIPNVFSPNGDNINDVFSVKGNNLSYFNCKIYDRWGIFLYEWSDVLGGWHGKNAANDNPVVDGTYYFLITYIDKKGKLGIKPGFVQLVR